MKLSIAAAKRLDYVDSPVQGHDFLVTHLESAAIENPYDSAFVFNDKNVVWKELKKKVDEFRAQLKPHEGKRALIFIGGRSEGDIALLIASSVLFPQSILISAFHSEERAREFMNDFNADILLSATNGEIKIHMENPNAADSDPEDVFSVGLLTSGTTGKPKCVRHSWERLASAVKINPRFKGKRWMMGYHITNFAGTQVFLQCFLNRGCLMIPSALPPATIDEADFIDRHAIQYLNGTATFARRLLITMTQPTLPTIRHITLGGEVVDQVLIDGLKQKFPNCKITHIYATTELGANIEVKDGREGFPLSFIDGEKLKIENDELHIKPTKRAMLGYLDQKLGNASGIIQLSQLNDPQWTPTGDIVEVVGDRVLFRGRKDLIVNVGGFKVNPMTVENVVRTVPGVKEVVVKAHKSPVVGNLLKAVVVLHEGQDKDAVKTAIMETCKAKLSYYSVPRLFEFTDKLELTSSQKIKR